MNDIAVIIPVHEIDGEEEKKLLLNAIENVKECQKNYDGKLTTYIVTPSELDKELTNDCEVLINDGEIDFCSQINYAAKNVSEDFFSILEFDDEYNPKWFSMAKNYYYTNEDVSVFLPINVDVFVNENYRQFANETPWASQFSNELGFVDFKCLENYYGINLTGGIFNRNDFNRVGGLKPSMKISFNYEFLLRITNKKLKVFVVPKEGYHHLIGRRDSLMNICLDTYKQEEVDKWYALAKQEYAYDEDREVTISQSEDNQ